MNFIDGLIALFKGDVKDEQVPEGYCPNCWGRQEYGGKFYEAVKTHGLDANRQDPDVGWIRDYAERHLKGIRLHEHGQDLICEQCKLSYRQTK